MSEHELARGFHFYTEEGGYETEGDQDSAGGRVQASRTRRVRERR